MEFYLFWILLNSLEYYQHVLQIQDIKENIKIRIKITPIIKFLYFKRYLLRCNRLFNSISCFDFDRTKIITNFANR